MSCRVCLCVQEDNGMPVHLKGGSSDALLYRTTMVLTVIGEAPTAPAVQGFSNLKDEQWQSERVVKGG